MRTPQQIIGDDSYKQLVFEGYMITECPPPLTVAALQSRIAELEGAVRAALEMVDGNGIPPNWDWMRAVLSNSTAEFFAKK